MVWYKSWLDTRWRFLIPLAILFVNACGLVLEYAPIAKVLPTVRVDGVAEGPIGRQIQEAVESQRDFGGFIWFQWFRHNLMQMGTIFAALLGSGCLLSDPAGGTLFTLSLPVSRNQWLRVRSALGLGELLLLVLIPSLAIPVVAPSIGEHFAAADVVIYGLCLFVVGSMFFSLAVLLSTLFNDTWRPLLFTCGIAAAVGLLESEIGFYGFYRVMTGTLYFRTGSLPWIGLAVSAATSGALLYAASTNLARKDF